MHEMRNFEILYSIDTHFLLYKFLKVFIVKSRIYSMHKFEISVPCIHCVQLSVQYTVPVVHEGLGHVLDKGDAQLDVGAEVEEEEPADAARQGGDEARTQEQQDGAQ